ncbi:MAG: hypothetical protein Kow00127_12060 [Bacteroidales bacterium]
MTFRTFIVIAFFATALLSCRHEPETVDLDNQLFDEIVNPAGWQWYQNRDTLQAAAPSPHGSFTLRFNQTAVTVLDSTLELPVGSVFPEGSVIVKEAIKPGSTDILVVMKKSPSGDYAAGGWQWAEYYRNGEVFYSVSKSGDACLSCHQSEPQRDLTKTFDLH